jgi:hypothetical protein
MSVSSLKHLATPLIGGCCATVLLLGCGKSVAGPTHHASTAVSSSLDSPQAAAACDTNGGATLLAAFTSTAAVVATWEDNSTPFATAGVWGTAASSSRVVGSPWHRYSADTVVYVCYWEGSFDGAGPPGCINAKPSTRLIAVAYPTDKLILTWTEGFDDQLPVQRPSVTGVEIDFGGPPPPNPPVPPC